MSINILIRAHRVFCDAENYSCRQSFSLHVVKSRLKGIRTVSITELVKSKRFSAQQYFTQIFRGIGEISGRKAWESKLKQTIRENLVLIRDKKHGSNNRFSLPQLKLKSYFYSKNFPFNLFTRSSGCRS